MHGFREIFKETGVDPVSHSMTVGLHGSNLVALHDAAGFDLRFDHSKLEVSQVTRETLSRASIALHRQFVLWNLAEEESARSYTAAMHAAANFGMRSRLFLVKGKVRDSAEIDAVSSRSKLELYVSVVPHLAFTVALRFLKLRDPSGAVSSTQWTPADARWLISKLNWVYGPQANVSFQLLDADWVTADVHQSDPLTGQEFLERVVSRKSHSADLTIFITRMYQSVDKIGVGETFVEEHVCIVMDNPPLPVTPGSDPFLVNFAHEVAHFLIDDPGDTNYEHNRPGVLLSRGLQSTRVDMPLVNLINS
jgi:hypothetical protein